MDQGVLIGLIIAALAVVVPVLVVIVTRAITNAVARGKLEQRVETAQDDINRVGKKANGAITQHGELAVTVARLEEGQRFILEKIDSNQVTVMESIGALSAKLDQHMEAG